MASMIRALLAAFVLLVAACGGDGVSYGTPCPYGTDCGSGGRCLIGPESTGICSSECDTDADCPDGVGCSYDPTDGKRWCGSCGQFPLAVGSVCVDDVQVACEDAGGAWNCGDCGCPDDQFCNTKQPAPFQCAPARQVGESCEEHVECLSDNCSATRTASGVCQVAAGAACDDFNCESCDQTPAGPICAQKCNDSACPQGSACVGSRERDAYYCRADCSAECPYGWTCDNVDVFSQVRSLCFPPQVCDVPGSGCDGGVCAALPGAGYNICVRTCTPSTTTNRCLPGTQCVAVPGGPYGCMPQPR